MSANKRILAIETSGRVGSVCVALGEAVLGRAELPSDARHAGGLHTAVDRLVGGQGWRPDELDEVYVSAGPGSFTGARIGITVARTLAWSIGAKIVRVPTVDALAQNALQIGPPPRFVAVVLDAKRAQIFTALFALTGGGAYEKIIDATLVEPLAFLTTTVPDRIRALPGNAGASPSDVAVLGEGVEYHRKAIEQAGAVILPREVWSARAEAVHAVGYRMAAAGQYCEPGDCIPIYVRIPEPEEKWMQKEIEKAEKRKSEKTG